MLAALQAVFAPRCQALDAWRENVRAAQSLEVHADYQQAAAKYESALKQLPAADDNDRAVLEAALAIDFIKLRQIDKGLYHGNQTLQVIRRLKARHNLDGETLISVDALMDACTRDFPEIRQQDRSRARNEDIRKLCEELAIATASDCSETASSGIHDLRSYIAYGKNKEALIALQNNLNRVDGRSPKYWPLRLKMASIKARQGHPEFVEEAKKEMRLKFSENEVVCSLAESQFWALDYGAAIATLDHALANLKQRKDDTVHDEAKIQSIYSRVYIEQGSPRLAEPHVRRWMDILSRNPEDKPELDDAKRTLAFCLRQLHRDKEANAVLGAEGMKGRADYEFMLSDEEKAALKKFQSKTHSKTEKKPSP